MIETDNQLEITKQWLYRFDENLKATQELTNVNPLIVSAQMAALESQIQIFKEDIAEYEQKNKLSGSAE